MDSKRREEKKTEQQFCFVVLLDPHVLFCPHVCSGAGRARARE
jgi:hypothetical protein